MLPRGFSAALRRLIFSLTITLALASAAVAQTTQPAAPLAIRGETIHTMAGPPIQNGVVLLRNGKIERVGTAAQMPIPAGMRTLTAKIVTPGLIDAHTIVGLQGFTAEPREADMLEKSAPIQPELRAMDAFNAREKLVEWVRGFGVTTIQTGHAPEILMSGQTMIIKTRGPTVDDGLLNPSAMLSVSLGESGIFGERGKPPGTRAKEVSMVRTELIKAQEYQRKRSSTRPATSPADDKTPARDLRLDVLVRVLQRQMPMLITAHRAQDILLALKLADEFKIKIVLDGASEAYLMIDQIKAAGVPVIIHPTMKRATGETENLSMETAAKLKAAGITIAMQSGYEEYVPKTRVVLFEAAMAAANGLSFNDALASITIDAARILGVDDRVGSIQAGKDADLALYDGDPFELTTHCVGTIIDGLVVSDKPN